MNSFLLSFLRTSTELPDVYPQGAASGSDSLTLNLSIFMIGVVVLLLVALAILVVGLTRGKLGAGSQEA